MRKCSEFCHPQAKYFTPLNDSVPIGHTHRCELDQEMSQHASCLHLGKEFCVVPPRHKLYRRALARRQDVKIVD